MCEVMDLWLKGQGTIKIEFVQTYDENNKSDNILFNQHHSNTNNSTDFFRINSDICDGINFNTDK